ncbi:511_t:CDS:1, partial [Ambispora leptoticha]
MSLKEITREENKMEIIKESPDISLIGKKYQYKEGMKSKAATQTQDVEIDSVQQQIQGLEITAKQQMQV